jgi:hypothetical protein
MDQENWSRRQSGHHIHRPDGVKIYAVQGTSSCERTWREHIGQPTAPGQLTLEDWDDVGERAVGHDCLDGWLAGRCQ